MVSRTLLLTNDDGIGAPGMAALERATEGLGARVVVAPSGPYSGCSHAVTTHKAIAVDRLAAGRFAVEGSPADCVRLGLDRLAVGFDWVVSGVNAGGNLGADVFHSGTVAAVREGVLHGRPGVAVSHYVARGRAVDWSRASAWAARVLARLIDFERPCEPGTFWNVNLPHPGPDAPEPGIVFCPLDVSPLPIGFRWEGDPGAARYCGDYQSRARVPGGDVAVCFGGDIAVTLLRLV